MTSQSLQDLLNNIAKSKMPEFDKGYAETIDCFWEKFIEPRLPKKEIVLAWHDLLMKYVDDEDCVFVVRAFSNTNKTPRRCLLTKTDDSFSYTYSDNGFGKLIAKMTYLNTVLSYDDFKNAMLLGWLPISEFIGSEEKSKAFYKMKKFEYAEYKLAHIIDSGMIFDIDGKLVGMQEICENYFPAGNLDDWKLINNSFIRNVKVKNDARKIVTAHFLRFVDPLNYVLTPKPARNGSVYQKSDVGISDIAEYQKFQRYAVKRFSELYGNTYKQFLKRLCVSESMNSELTESSNLGNSIIKIHWGNFSLNEKKVISTCITHSTGPNNYKVCYSYNRLIFFRDIIESLKDDDMFACKTPEGTYAMSKKDFYRVFANVANNITCYQQDGKYSYSTTPSKAKQFLIE